MDRTLFRSLRLVERDYHKRWEKRGSGARTHSKNDFGNRGYSHSSPVWLYLSRVCRQLKTLKKHHEDISMLTSDVDLHYVCGRPRNYHSHHSWHPTHVRKYKGQTMLEARQQYMAPPVIDMSRSHIFTFSSRTSTDRCPITVRGTAVCRASSLWINIWLASVIHSWSFFVSHCQD